MQVLVKRLEWVVHCRLRLQSFVDFKNTIAFKPSDAQNIGVYSEKGARVLFHNMEGITSYPLLILHH